MKYTYECPDCGRFEVTRPMNADKLTRCQLCGGEEVELCFYPPLIQFKGDAWSHDNYTRGGKK